MMTSPAAQRRPISPTTEGDLWRRQLETLEALTKFIRTHRPGKPGALPTVCWTIDTGSHAVARLSIFDGPGGTRRSRHDVLAAYAEAFGSEVISVDLGDGYTGYRVHGAVGERDRIKLTVIATLPVEDETAVHWAAPGLPATTLCQGQPLVRESFAARKSDLTCPDCLALIAEPPAGVRAAG